jgi:hypothetical protein
VVLDSLYRDPLALLAERELAAVPGAAGVRG